jgi:subtilisin family serine protease
VVYIHGINNKPIASVLKCQWDTALFGSEMGDCTRMAYWVDRDRYPEPVRASCASSDATVTEDDQAVTANILALTAGAPPIDGAAREAEAMARELQALAGGDAARQRILESIAAQTSAAAQRASREAGVVAAAGLASPGRASARLLPFGEATRRMLTRLLTRSFLRDVNDFLFDEAKRERMTQSLWDRLRGGGEPFVVIAHSQGSMIAYELLRSLPAEACDVALFVTIGSPLGLTEVQDHFRLGGPLTTPACVQRWVNIADRLDPVAADPTLAGEYKANAAGILVEDINDLALNLDSPRDPHSGTGYLRSAAVRDVVHDLLGNAFAQALGGSVVSRDVAARGEDAEAEALHDVLIQLTDVESDGTPRALSEVADQLVEQLRQLATARTIPEAFEEPDRMRRFVQARLTRAEIEALRTLSAELHVKQVWANATKRALVHRSAGTVQARPANLGYDATGRDIGWAVIDTGIDARHPHFAPHNTVRAQWDCLKSGPPRLLAGDENGHGTHVAGIIAGGTEGLTVDGKSTRLSGMAPQASLYSFRTLDKRGEGSDASIIKALDKIAAINEDASALVIHGINLSLGSSFDPRIYGCGHTPLCQELRRLWRQGVLVVVAAGNEGFAELSTAGGTVSANMDLSIGDPANLEEAIAVVSVHKSNPHTFGISYFSSRGPTADGRRKPDVVAPGEKILSAMANARPDDPKRADGWYVEMSGTSMAAPHVSGVLAAFLSARREFIGEPDRVKRILLSACTDLERDPNMQGAGLINLVKMLLQS